MGIGRKASQRYGGGAALSTRKKDKEKGEELTEEELFSAGAELAGVPEVDVVVLKCPVEGCTYMKFMPEYDPLKPPLCPHHNKKLVLVKKWEISGNN